MYLSSEIIQTFYLTLFRIYIVVDVSDCIIENYEVYYCEVSFIEVNEIKYNCL